MKWDGKKSSPENKGNQTGCIDENEHGYANKQEGIEGRYIACVVSCHLNVLWVILQDLFQVVCVICYVQASS